MKTILFYGLERKSIKEMTAKAEWLSDEIKKTQQLAKKQNCNITTLIETNKRAITIKVLMQDEKAPWE